MKRILVILPLLLIGFSALFAEDNPVADPAAIVTSGDMRFTVLTPEMIRIEWSGQQQFEDRPTFSVINRRLPVPQFTKEEKDGFLYIKTEKLTLQYRIGAFPGTFDPPSSKNLKITFDLNGKTVTWYPWKKDPLNLKGTCRTLDGSNGDNKLSELEDGLISRSGWAVIDETAERADGSISLAFDKRENGIDWVSQRKDKTAMDWYFMGYGYDYKKALSDFTKIAGKIPMPPLYAFGYWYSKYEEYTDEDFKNLAREMQAHDIPVDVMVIDMDWHYSGSEKDNYRGGWTGWSWNKRLIPNPAELLQWLHDNNLKATLNLHPADGIATDEDNFAALANELGLPMNETVQWNIENEDFYKAFFKHILRPHENIGVDFWWLDWQQWLLAKNEEKLGNTFWLNHVFFNDMKQKEQARPLIFHRWGGLGNHRYQIGFSGDAHTNFPTLAFQPYFTSTASNVGYGYWSHDIGGHHQDDPNDPELFLRWIQYGVFSPIVRTHSSKNAAVERRIWKYPNFPLMKEALELRYAMVPYIYTQARAAYDTGISICRPLYYEWPNENEAYKRGEEYLFGADILVAPIVERSDANEVSKKNIWLPEGKWYEVTSGEVLDGNKTYVRQFSQGDIPHYYREGAIIPFFAKLSHLKKRPDHLILKFAPGKSGELQYYEDENDNDNYEKEAYTFTHVKQEVANNNGIYTIYPTTGSFNGMLTDRSYELNLLAVTQPEEVNVNGVVYTKSSLKTSGSWYYDESSKTAYIYLPKTSSNAKTEIKVKFSESGSAIEEVTETNDARFSYSALNRQGLIEFGKTHKDVSLSIFDITGKTVLSLSYQNIQKVLFSVPNSMSDGAYLVSFTYDKKRQTEKLVL